MSTLLQFLDVKGSLAKVIEPVFVFTWALTQETMDTEMILAKVHALNKVSDNSCDM